MQPDVRITVWKKMLYNHLQRFANDLQRYFHTVSSCFSDEQLFLNSSLRKVLLGKGGGG